MELIATTREKKAWAKPPIGMSFQVIMMMIITIVILMLITVISVIMVMVTMT